MRGENVGACVDVCVLAQQTVDFSGSDLKHLVFSAALAAFKDTVPELWKSMGEVDECPLPQRILKAQHFEHAIGEITASSASTMDAVRRLRTWGGSLSKAA